MANVTITSPNKQFQGTIAGVRFTDGVATADDTTQSGKALISFASRKGWQRGSTAATVVSIQDGLPVALWSPAQMRAYLDSFGVVYPADASEQDLQNAVQTAYETRAQGGSAAVPTAGHTQGTFPVLGAPNVPGDDDAKAALWEVPVISQGGDQGTVPTITTQPTSVSPVDGATASFTVAGAGVPEPTVQWQKRESAGGNYVDIAGATSGTYTTGAISAADRGDRYRAVVTNPTGSVTSNPAEVLPSAV